MDAEAIVEQELSRFMTWWDSLEAAPIVKTLRQQAEDIRQRELAKALRRLRDLDPDDRDVIDALTQSIVNALLHEPTAFLKQGADRSQIDTVKDLFRLWDDPQS